VASLAAAVYEILPVGDWLLIDLNL